MLNQWDHQHNTFNLFLFTQIRDLLEINTNTVKLLCPLAGWERYEGEKSQIKEHQHCTSSCANTNMVNADYSNHNFFLKSSGSNIIKKETKYTICGFFTFRKLHNVLLQKMPSPYRHLMQQMFCMLEARHRRTDNRNVLWESNFYRPQTDHNCAFAICTILNVHTFIEVSRITT